MPSQIVAHMTSPTPPGPWQPRGTSPATSRTLSLLAGCICTMDLECTRQMVEGLSQAPYLTKDKLTSGLAVWAGLSLNGSTRHANVKTLQVSDVAGVLNVELIISRSLSRISLIASA
jgi:hypothetical protein